MQDKGKKTDDKKKKYHGKRGKKPYDKKDRKDEYKGKDPKEGLLNPEGRDNDPNWYFTDAALADQVSQLSFQQLAGLPIHFAGTDLTVPNIVKIWLNPSPGVINSADYGSNVLNKTSGINLAGFRIFSKLSAYTGRIASYGPQDISIMILGMGEIISTMEWCRRAFGVANAMSMRNRSYPREILNWGMLIDEDDFFKNFAVYRTRFNGLVTMVNQLPIPKGIKYFDKCAAIYEKLYFDDDSSMAQSLITNPYTTWILDEVSDSRGSIMKTVPWHADPTSNYTNGVVYVPKTMGDYLDICDTLIGAMLNSSTLQTVYTDLLNLALKVGQEFWKLDYLNDGYTVIPEYNPNLLLQIHNATLTGQPLEPTELTSPHVTALNDVVPNANTNSVYYNPGFSTQQNSSGYISRTNADIIVDMTNSVPSVVDRVEVTRYCSVSGTNYYASNAKACDAVLPDHYVVGVAMYCTDSSQLPYLRWVNSSNLTATQYPFIVSGASTIDWFPRFYQLTAANALSGVYAGDLNYYTVVDSSYLRRLHQFMTLGIFDLRSK